MAVSTQDALVRLMVVAAAADASGITDRELARIAQLVSSLPVFAGFDIDRLTGVINTCVDEVNRPDGLDSVLDATVAALPERLQDTAYALAVEISAVDLRLEQAELRLLEMIRDRLRVDRLVTAAIEAAARARHRRLQ